MVVGAGLLLLMRATHGNNYLTYVLPDIVVFGAGLALTVAPLTSTAMGAAPPEHAGVASAVNNVVARAAGLLAVAVLPLLAGITGAGALAPAHFAAGFRTAVLISGLTCVAGGFLAAATIRNPAGEGTDHPLLRRWYCAIDATPLQPGAQEPGAQDVASR